MSTSKLQELLEKQNLSLQELSDRSGLPIETIETIEPKVQEVFTNLQKIAQSLDTPVPKLLELFGISKESDRLQESTPVVTRTKPKHLSEPDGARPRPPVDCSAIPTPEECK